MRNDDVNDDERQSLLKDQQSELYTDETTPPSLLDAHDDQKTTNENQSNSKKEKSPWNRWIPMLVFWPIGRIISLGHKKAVTDKDLDNLSEADKCSYLSKKLSINDWLTSKTWIIVLRTFWKDTLYVEFLSLLYFTARIAQPLLLREITINIYRDAFPAEQTRTGYLYAFLLFLAIIAHGFFHQQYFFRGAQVGLRVSNTLSSIIYQHLLSLNQLSIQKINAAQAINLIANDASKFEEFWSYGTFIWLVPLECIIIFCLLCWIIGPIPALVGYCVLLILIIIQTLCSRRSGHYYQLTMNSIDKRIKAYGELVYGRSTIKMYNWEKPMEEQIYELRKQEMSSIRKASYLRAVNGALYYISPSLIAAFAFGSIWLMGRRLEAANIFSALMFFNLLRLSVTCLLPMALERLSTMLVASDRIDAFMHLGTMDSGKSTDSSMTTNETDKTTKGTIIMRDASFSWGPDDTCLQSLNMNIKSGELVGVVGQVGSGKSSLLAAILGEMNHTSGERNVSGTISYAPQLTCIFPDTIRANVLLGQSMDRERYDRVLRACCLDVDLNVIGGPGDMTMLGEQGVNLSGGQKARISLARALYRDADIYLFDDPLAAVDVNVAKKIFKDCLGPQGILNTKTRVLVTHQTHFLSDSYQTMLLANGRIEAQGSFDQLSILQNFETQKHGTVSMGKKDDQTSGVSAEELDIGQTGNDDKSILADETSASGDVKWIIWYRLFSAPPLGWLGFVLFIIILVVTETTFDVSNLWLAVWAQEPFSEQQENPWLAYIYFFLVLGVLIFGFIYAFYWFYTMLQGANHLHNTMLKGILNTSTRFFESNPSGRILNRASRDQHITDKLLPEILFDAVQTLMISFGSAIIVIIVTPWTLILFVPFILVVAWLYYRYARINYQLKRLETISRSPIYTLFSSSLNGLTIIRSFNVKNDFIQTFMERIDIHTRASLTMKSAIHWFGVRIELISAPFALIVAILIFADPSKVSPALLSLCLTYCLTLINRFQWGATQLAESRTLIISAQRIDEYAELPPEEDNGGEKGLVNLPSNWPIQGEINFQNYSLRYRPELEPTLKSINLHIEPTEKIGIVGRTGK